MGWSIRLAGCAGAALTLLFGAACSSEGTSVEATGRSARTDAEAIPLEAAVLAVVATDHAGWVVTGESSTSLLWRVASDGTSRRIAEVAGTSVQLSTNGDEVFASSVRCSNGQPECESTDLGTVDVFADDGERRGSVEFARSNTAGASVSYEVAGVIDATLWLGALDRAVQIGSQDGAIGEVVDDAPGSLCAIGGRLFGLSSSQAGSAEQQSPGQPPVASGLPSDRSYGVLVASGDRWVDVPDGTIEVPGGAFDVICSPAGYEVVDYGQLETPASVWTSAGGQVQVPSGDLPEATVTSPYRSPHGQAYIVRTDGAVMRREPGSAAYTTTGFEVDPDGPMGASVPLVDESASLGVMCPAEGRTAGRCQVKAR